MKIKIYAMTHKKFDVPQDKMYVPLQVGAAVHEPLGYLRDDSGENISALNCYYSELTGLYWVWKNDQDSDVIGSCHYRRYLIDENEIVLTAREIEEYLADYDLITTKKVHLENSYRDGFAANHNLAALDTAGEVIRDIYPSYYGTFVRLVNGPDTYFGNMIIAPMKTYKAYCEWLFTIFDEVRNRINLDTDEDSYHKRVLGFISEFLLLVWTTVNGLKVKECKVGMFGEKAEVRELKERLAGYFESGDEQSAKKELLNALQKRPDLLMEASDITGELRMSMELIAITEGEREIGKELLIGKLHDYRKLMELISNLNQCVLNRRRGEKYKEFEGEELLSETAYKIAEMILPETGIKCAGI